MLYRELAPISSDTWEEIDERANEVLKTYLSARKVVRVNGPKGLDFNAISEGRLNETAESGNVKFANYKLIPLTETRIEFEIDRWELDNVQRGAKDVDLKPMEEALRELALLEDKAVFNGLEKAGIKGLEEYVEEEIPFGNNNKEIMASVLNGVIKLRDNFIGGSYTLVVGEETYKKILSQEGGYPLSRKIEELIEGKILLSRAIEGAYLLPYDHEDLEFTIGRDYSIGYQNHTNEKVRFFVAESFTFRVLDPGLIVRFTI